MDSNHLNIKKICVYGVGGVGGYFGGKIADAISHLESSALEIYFIARGEHLEKIKSNGLKVITPEKTFTSIPTQATSDVTEIPVPDLFFLCIKSYDLDLVVQSIAPMVEKETVIIPLLNGADIYERIRCSLKTGIVLPACVFVGTQIERPGVIIQSGGDGAILFGKDSQFPEYTGEELINLFQLVGINHKWHDDPFESIWTKYIFIAAYGLVTAYTGKTIGEVIDNAEAKGLVRGVMAEIRAIATAQGIRLPGDIVETSLEKAMNFPYDTKTSYQRDVEYKGKVNEGDLYGGTILRQAKKWGIPTPITQLIYSIIQERLA